MLQVCCKVMIPHTFEHLTKAQPSMPTVAQEVATNSPCIRVQSQQITQTVNGYLSQAPHVVECITSEHLTKEHTFMLFGGTQEGHHLTMYSCPKRNDHPNCQWALEPSPTRRGMYYIKASDRSEYIHAHGGTNGGNQLTMYSCPKSRDYPNCQWRLELPNDELANELTAELEDLTADYNTLKAECNAIAARANRISDGYHDLRTRYEELKADYNAKFGLLQADGKVFQSNDDKVNELKERLADTKAEYSMLKAECNEKTAATEDMTVEYKDLDHRYKALQAEYEAKSR